MTPQEASDIILVKSKSNKRNIAALVERFMGDANNFTKEQRQAIIDVAVNVHTLGVMAGLELSLENPEVAKVEL